MKLQKVEKRDLVSNKTSPYHSFLELWERISAQDIMGKHFRNGTIVAARAAVKCFGTFKIELISIL